MAKRRKSDCAKMSDGVLLLSSCGVNKHCGL